MRKTLRLLATAALVLPLVVSASAAQSEEAIPVAGGASAASAPQLETVGTEYAVQRRLHAGQSSTVIGHDGAWYMKVHLSDVRLAEGDVLTVSSRDGEERHVYSADQSGELRGELSRDDAGYWAMSITGDSAVVSIAGADGGAASPASGAVVDRVARGFTEAEFAERRAFQAFSICGSNDYRDAVCYQSSYPAEYAKRSPIAKLLIQQTSLCTAWRVGPNNRMLTNNHCVDTSAEVKGSEVIFNYECTTCGGSTSRPVTKVMGSSLLRTNYSLDFTLFSVDNFTAISGFGYLTLDNRVPAVGEEMYIIQHPGGALKKIAVRDDTSSNGICKVTATRVNGRATGSDIAYKCDTIGGSSGSPVLSRSTHRVIGLHHYGGCPNQGVRSDLIYAQISSLL